MNRQRTKFFNTEAKLYKALIQLLEEKDFCDIEISELCAVAEINRSTFYAHFNNMHDLLQSANNEIFKAYSENFINKIFASNENNDYFFTPQYLAPFLEFVKTNKTIWRTYLNNEKTFHFDFVYAEKFEDVYLRVFNRYGITDAATVSYMSTYFLSGLFAIIKRWLNNDCKDDVSQICSVIEACTATSEAVKMFRKF